MSKQHTPEPFGYFKAEPFGWTDCAETDDGAWPLYDKQAIDNLIQQRDEEVARNRPLRDLITALETQKSILLNHRTKYQEAVATLDSERAANAKLTAERDTAWAQAHRLALELECLLLDTKDNAVMSKWWDSGMEALSEYQELQPQAAENAEAWAAMRKANI